MATEADIHPSIDPSADDTSASLAWLDLAPPVRCPFVCLFRCSLVYGSLSVCLRFALIRTNYCVLYSQENIARRLYSIMCFDICFYVYFNICFYVCFYVCFCVCFYICFCMFLYLFLFAPLLVTVCVCLCLYMRLCSFIRAYICLSTCL